MSPGVRIIRGPTDPLCVRISVGGTEEVGYYCVFRGNLAAAIKATEQALLAMKLHKKSGVELAVNRDFKELGAS